ncbi:MAG: hypothetical protein OXQ89_16960 [Rhodospirillaceae bacterium]|nr:hypothetical protein [Rhodospirillaceae bacterium]MDE0361379.1 hypothetical protein [Rhodospirillaceae bacterium]
MSWESIVRGIIKDENPELHADLLNGEEGEYEDYVTDVTRRMVASYRHATADGTTDAASRATAREIAIAQAREEIAPPEVLEWGELDEDGARDFLRDFYGGAGV